LRIEFNLNPNCSEAVFRFYKVWEVDTSSERDIKDFIQELYDEIRDSNPDGKWHEEWIFYDNIGGGAHIGFMEKLSRLVEKFSFTGEKLTEKKINKLYEQAEK